MTNAFITLAAAAVLTSLFGAVVAQARDASRASQAPPSQTPPSQTPAHAIPNPYAAPSAPSASPGADAYSTGFAIGLGTALINKQREDELKRQQQQGAGRR